MEHFLEEDLHLQTTVPFDTFGYFWLPGKPKQRLPGVLHVSVVEQTTLEVIGDFGDPFDALSDRSQDIPRIVGVVENGDFVTIEQCFYKHRTINFGGGLAKATIVANFLLRGVQYDEGEVIEFSEFSFSTDGLDEWLSLSGVHVEHKWSEKTASIHFFPPNEIAYELPDGITVGFTFTWNIPFEPVVTEAAISQKAFVTIKSESPRSLKEVIILMVKIRNFLSFAIDEMISIDSVTCYIREVTGDIRDEVKRQGPISVYYLRSQIPEDRAKISRQNMLFRYGDIENKFGVILTEWLQNYETSEPAFSLYFASKARMSKHLEGHFLLLAQGIETLHRRNFTETSMPEAKFDQLVTALMEICPDQKTKEWLKQKMEYANELPLRKRLRQMLDPFKEYYGSAKQQKRFIDSVIITRNYLTHYDVNLSMKAVKGEDLWRLCMKLEALFQLHFLRLVGLDVSLINNLIERNEAIRGKLDA